MLNLRDLLQEQAELKRQGNALWTDAEQKTKGMNRVEKDAYMVEVRAKDDEIMANLRDVQDRIKRAEAYREQEHDEIREVMAQPTDPPRPTGRNEFSSFGEFLQAAACVQSNIVAGMFPPSKRAELEGKMRLYQAAASGMSVASPPDGGFLVRKEWTDVFLNEARSQSLLLPMCRRIPVGPDADSLEYPYIDESSRVDGSRFGGVQIFWRAEAATVTASAPKIGKGELRLEELMGLAYATERLLRDAPALQAVLTQAFSEEFGFVVDNSIIRGNGAGQMLGILNSPILATVTRDGTDHLVTITALWEVMPSRLKATAVWLYHAGWFKRFIGLKVGETPVFVAPGGISSTPGGAATILGRPAYELEQATAMAAVGDLMLCNFGQYVYIEKDGEGLRFDQSMHIRFLYDEMAFRWMYRINGQPVQRVATTRFTTATTSTATSPFVAVAT